MHDSSFHLLCAAEHSLPVATCIGLWERSKGEFVSQAVADCSFGSAGVA